MSFSFFSKRKSSINLQVSLLRLSKRNISQIPRTCKLMLSFFFFLLELVLAVRSFSSCLFNSLDFRVLFYLWAKNSIFDSSESFRNGAKEVFGSTQDWRPGFFSLLSSQIGSVARLLLLSQGHVSLISSIHSLLSGSDRFFLELKSTLSSRVRRLPVHI